MKKQIKMILAMLLLTLVFLPSAKVQATVAAPGVPTGLGIYSQSGSEFALSWDVDNLVMSYIAAGMTSGYEVQVTDLKGNIITTMNSSTNTYDFKIDSTTNKIVVIINSNQMKKAGFKFVVRSFVMDETNNPIYSPFTPEKVIIPRATIKKNKLAGDGKVKVSWNKISKAKGYTVYLSSNDGKKYKKVGKTKGTSFVISNLKSYTDYYVYVSANKVKYGGKKYNSTKPVDKNSGRRGFRIYRVYR